MSPDLRRVLSQAAPRPRGALDTNLIERRVARRRRRRVLVLGVALVLAASGAAAVPKLWTGATNRPAGGDDGAPEIPGGPRYEVASGTFPSDWSEPRAGNDWTFLAWGEGDTTCWQLVTEPAQRRDEGLSCSAPRDGQPEETGFLGSLSFETGANDPDAFVFTVGEVSPDVAYLELEPDGGDVVPYQVVDAPPGAGVPGRYYAIVLPSYDYADFRALASDGTIVETQHLCGPGCRADREAEEDAKVAAYEATPVSDEARAAAFGVEALGEVGLLDQFGLHYAYRGIEDSEDGFLLTFEVEECDPSKPSGAYACDRAGAGRITVARDGDDLRVIAVEGEMSRSQEEDLLATRGPIPSGPPEWHSAATGLRETAKGWAVGFTVVWTGDLPGPANDYGSGCSFELVDADGRVRFGSREVPFEVGHDEAERVAAPVSEVDGDFGDIQEAAVHCSAPRRGFLEDLSTEESRPTP